MAARRYAGLTLVAFVGGTVLGMRLANTFWATTMAKFLTDEVEAFLAED